jgi:hypothetical protein
VSVLSKPRERNLLLKGRFTKGIEYHPVDLQALAECALARAKCPLGRKRHILVDTL